MFALLSPAALSPGAAVGIDLGTTSSTIAAVRDGKPHIIHSLPSTVRFTDSAPLVGVGAPCIRSAKRLIGRSFAEVQNEPAVRAHFGPLLQNTDDAAALLTDGARQTGAARLTAVPKASGANGVLRTIHQLHRPAPLPRAGGCRARAELNTAVNATLAHLLPLLGVRRVAAAARRAAIGALASAGAVPVPPCPPPLAPEPV